MADPERSIPVRKQHQERDHPRTNHRTQSDDHTTAWSSTDCSGAHGRPATRLAPPHHTRTHTYNRVYTYCIVVVYYLLACTYDIARAYVCVCVCMYIYYIITYVCVRACSRAPRVRLVRVMFSNQPSPLSAAPLSPSRECARRGGTASSTTATHQTTWCPRRKGHHRPPSPLYGPRRTACPSYRCFNAATWCVVIVVGGFEQSVRPDTCSSYTRTLYCRRL